jgi:hypothetical protein
MNLHAIRTATLDEIIAHVNSTDDYNLDMSRIDAAYWRDAIVKTDRGDDAALAAHDLLHARAVLGRAF